MRFKATAAVILVVGLGACLPIACSSSPSDTTGSKGVSSSSGAGGEAGMGGMGMGGQGGGSAGGCVKDVAAGWDFVVALREDGTLFSWGKGYYQGTKPPPYAVPTPVDGPTDFVAVEAAYWHSIALRADGTVWTWGDGSTGALGLGNLDFVETPTQVPGISNVTFVATAAGRSTVVTNEGHVYEWGSIVGANGPEMSLTPVKVMDSPGDPIVALGSADGFSAVLTHYGGVYVWGPKFGATPLLLFTNIARLSVSASHLLALSNEGDLWEWGDVAWDQMAAFPAADIPVLVPNFVDVVDVFAGLTQNAVQKSDGTVWIWGADPVTAYHPSHPVAFPGLFKKPQLLGGGIDPKTIAFSYATAGLVNGQGQCRIWGPGRAGELGGGNEGFYPSPRSVLNLQGAKRVRGGYGVAFAIEDDGSLWAWGNPISGALGDGSTEIHASPVQVQGLSDVVDVAPAYRFTLVLDAAGRVWSFGNNDAGQLGDGTTLGHEEPKQIVGLPLIKAIAAGTGHALAVAVDGSVWAWGRNDSGQLGNGTEDPSFVPKIVPGLGGVSSVGAGSCFSAALKDDGTVWTFGCGGNGSLGVGFVEKRLIPVEVMGLDHVVSVDSRELYTLALRDDGTVWGWGWSEEAQLAAPDGLGVYGFPLKVPGIANIAEISAGFEHALALDQSGHAWGWGTAYRGQLAGHGMGLATNYVMAPVLLDVLGEVTTLAAGMDFSLYVGADKTVRASGINYGGEIGIDIFPFSTEPVDPGVPCPP